MANRAAGKKAFITGAAQGLGEAMARALAGEGAKVVLADVNFVGADKLAGELNAKHGDATAFAFELDVTDEGQWIAALVAADAAMGGISALVNNAGIAGGKGGVEEMSLADFKRVMSVNVDSVFLGAKHAIKYLSQNQPASIVNISSIAGLIASHNTPAYNASKAAVWLLSKNIALYCAKKGLDIRSNSIHPTFIDTPILDPLRAAFGKQEAEAKLARQGALGRIGKRNNGIGCCHAFSSIAAPRCWRNCLGPAFLPVIAIHGRRNTHRHRPCLGKERNRQDAQCRACQEPAKPGQRTDIGTEIGHKVEPCDIFGNPVKPAKQAFALRGQGMRGVERERQPRLPESKFAALKQRLSPP